MSSTRAESIKQIALKNNLLAPKNFFPTSEIVPAKVYAGHIFPAEYQLLKTGFTREMLTGTSTVVAKECSSNPAGSF